MACARLNTYSQFGPEGPRASAIWRAIVSQGAPPSQLALAVWFGLQAGLAQLWQ